jgi:hypothetical protein
MDYDSTKPDRHTTQFNLSARKILNKAGNFGITPPNFIGISHFVQGVSLYLYLSGSPCVIRDLHREFTEILQSDKNLSRKITEACPVEFYKLIPKPKMNRGLVASGPKMSRTPGEITNGKFRKGTQESPTPKSCPVHSAITLAAGETFSATLAKGVMIVFRSIILCVG